MSQLDQIALAALSSRETLQASYDLATLAIKNGIPGDFVECGVFGGAQCAAMALALMDWLGLEKPGRRVHLFDSFTGIPSAGPNDTNWTHPEGTSKCSLEDVQFNMKQWGIDEKLLVYHPGLFRDTLSGAVVGSGLGTRYYDDGLHERGIALLRIDCDLYESTKICMEYLYPLVSPGGWIIVDDFALPGCRKAVLDYLSDSFPPIYFQRPR